MVWRRYSPAASSLHTLPNLAVGIDLAFESRWTIEVIQTDVRSRRTSFRARSLAIAETARRAAAILAAVAIKNGAQHAGYRA